MGIVILMLPYDKTRVYKEFNKPDFDPTSRRFLRAFSDQMEILDTPPLRAHIKSLNSGKTYEVTLDSCECDDFKYRKVICKHMFRLGIEAGLFPAADVDIVLQRIRESADVTARKASEDDTHYKEMLQKHYDIVLQEDIESVRESFETELSDFFRDAKLVNTITGNPISSMSEFRAWKAAVDNIVIPPIVIAPPRKDIAPKKSSFKKVRKSTHPIRNFFKSSLFGYICIFIVISGFIAFSMFDANPPQRSPVEYRYIGSSASSSDSKESKDTNIHHNPEQQNTEYYVLNKSTKKFHYSNCGYVPKIKSSNYGTAKTREKAISSGYKPCAKCRP